MSRKDAGQAVLGPGASAAIPKGVWVLGFVSMFMDISSEMVHSLLPVFMVSTLGAGPIAVGLVEGVAEATALITKVFSGTLSDYWGRRKALVIFGYGLGALSKPLFAVAGAVDAVLAARFIDRIGKGMRGAPRDALVADLTPESIRGEAYGLRQSLDTIGAFVGPVIAIVLMVLWKGNYRAVFWLAALPAAFSVFLLIIGIREPAQTTAKPARRAIDWRALNGMGRTYWVVVAAGAVFTLARFSEAFLILRARQLGLSDAYAPGVLILMNVIYAISAYPAGYLADRLDRRTLLACGLALLIASDLALAQANGLALAAVGVSLWGLHLGMTQGLLATMVAAAASSELRGTAFGLFNLASGITMLIASVLAGWLWMSRGSSATFYAGAGFATAALVVLLTVNESTSSQ